MKLFCSLILKVAAIAIVAESAAPQVEIESGPAIFNSEAILAAAWRDNTPEGGVFSTETIYAFEETTSDYLSELLRLEEGEGDYHLVVASVNVKEQELAESGTGRSTVLLKSSVIFSFVADKAFLDSAAVLNGLFDSNAKKSKMLTLLKDAGAIGSDTASLDMVFTASETESQQVLDISHLTGASVQRSAASKGLLATVIFLVIALLFVSFLLIWIAGGWDDYNIPSPLQRFRDQHFFSTPVKAIKEKKTLDEAEEDDIEDDDDATTASGMLGANPMYDMENSLQIPGMTPPKPGHRVGNDDVSPLTNITNMTDTSRAPLGIRSIRKINKYLTPDKRKSQRRYAVPQLTYGSPP